MRFEYVASGMAYSKLAVSGSDEMRGLISEVDRLCNLVREKTGIEISYLYNGYSEGAFPEKLKHFRKSFDKVHADSGGLQVITQGLKVDKDIRKKIYESQSHQDTSVAMCFDKIPLKVIGDKSGRNDFLGRQFDPNLIEPYAKETAQYIVEQAEVFERKGSDTKIYAILQGNCVESYKRWANVLFDNIPQDVIPRIGGYAIGFGCLGSGKRESLIASMVPYYLKSEIPDSASALHLLGLGSVNRALPYIIAINSGLMPVKHISFDSTTHTGGFSLGSFFLARNKSPLFQTLKTGRNNKISYIEVLGRLKENIGIEYSDTEKVRDAMFLSRPEYLEKHEDIEFYHTFCIQCIFSSIIDFCSIFDRGSRDSKYLKRICNDSKGGRHLIPLCDVSSPDDYISVFNQMDKHLESSSVKVHSPKSTSLLDDLF